MAPAANDDNVIGRLGVRLAPCRLPVLVAGQRILQDRKSRVFRHRGVSSEDSRPAADYRAAFEGESEFCATAFHNTDFGLLPPQVASNSPESIRGPSRHMQKAVQ